MEHLVRRGCRRIVHLGGPAHIPNARERLRGFRYALGKFGFVSDGRSVIPAGVTFDDGRAAADELLRRMPDADGLFAWTDTVAIGAMNRLRELGIRVPAQMAVAGYSGTVLSTIVNPQLTTVEQPLDEMGCRAAELVLEKIAEAEAIEIADEKIDEEINKMAEMYKMEADKLKEMLGDAEKEQMKKDMAVQEAVTILADAAKEVEKTEE